VSERLETIATFRDLPEALLAEGRLKAAGIACGLADDNVVRMDWFWSTAMGGIKLQVEAADAAEARAQLADLGPDSFSVDEAGEVIEQPHCPRCGSRDISYHDTNRWISLAILWATGLPLPLRGGNWRCDACDAAWVVEGESEDGS
jgi:hypothetical protein